MFPLFGDERRRQINLGGASSAASYDSILREAKERRLEREDQRRRQDSAVRIQAWWRGMRESARVRQVMRQAFAEDVTGINGLRCLVLIGRDQDVLGTWSTTILLGGEDSLFRLATGPDHASWSVLIRQASFLLLHSISLAPQSQYATAHLQVLNALLSPSPRTKKLGPQGSDVTIDIMRYLLNRNLYSYLATAIARIDIEAKTSPSLPPLISLVTLPLISSNPSSDMYITSLEQIFIHILTIPLLPNRLPLTSLTTFSGRLPISAIHTLPSSLPATLVSCPIEAKVHLIANLLAFTPPRYPKLPAQPLAAYLQLLAELMNSLPINALDPPEPRSSSAQQSVAGPWIDDSDSDSDSESHPQVAVVTSFEPKPILPQLDKRTRHRLQSLPSPSHINSILTATHRYTTSQPALFAFLMALCTVWPSRKDRVLGAAVAYSSGGLVRELYRGYIRSSVLGRDDRPGAIMDPANASLWPPLLFLTDLYTQALLTMGDDEFFSSMNSAVAPSKTTSAARNPLSLDDLTTFSRKLLNIAFVLYWREDQAGVMEGGVPGLPNLKWEGVREKVTKCLQAIHARDSRKPFTPPDHWLITSQIDVSSFIEAAVLEEQRLAQPVGTRPLSKRQISYLSPRLGVLHNIPFSIPFEVRVSIFRHFVANDMMNQGYDRFSRMGRNRVSVRRGRIAEDGFDKLADADLKAPIEISFIDQFGAEEAGIDGGGVFKEFLTSLCKEVFDRDRGLWLANKKNELYPNPHSYAKEAHSLNWYRFIGRVLGKALYEGILVDVAFAGFFLAKWLGKQSFLDDLASLDPDLYNGLIFLKHYSGNPEDLSLTFTVDQEEFGVTKSTELIPNGSNIPVTKENRLQYITLVSHYRLSRQIKAQSEAFFEGLSQMIDSKWIRMFNQQELQILLGGVDNPIDLEDLRKHTNYGGLYDDEEETISAFWSVVNSFNHDQRRALLRFVTSCSRPPLLGFKELLPNFSIRDAGADENRLPTASTCVNLLKLPRYKSTRILREKLLQAIHSGAGFDLS
ncbi:hypothetical protein JAAARDRAFT_41256 [Jaapia argillacea MUCL 33604]|uniref:HECT-type E3 ubiquitin transferase n=1 Tax=Jaapia argillacea MUCL 33604 TaxID=933084 RepID=A0A067P8T6_9AGAM|nr:hypothetical protein JAAARDRAFT_41256 [Jaapia argillacea MUCL 33604]